MRGDIISLVSSRSKIMKFSGVISLEFLPRIFSNSLTIIYTNADAYEVAKK